jgi:hypothetical protein
MGPSGETWSQWILGHRPFTRLHQIDRLVSVLTGAGERTIDNLSLTHGRYTIFVREDPEGGIASFQMSDDAGFQVDDDWKWRGIGAPLVQTEVPKGTYRLTIAARFPSVSWEIQVVLNSMLSWAAAPKPWRPTRPPPAPIQLSESTTARFQIARTGHYGMEFSIGDFKPDQPVFPREFGRFKLSLRANDGHTIRLAEGAGNTASWPTGAFLGAGDWTVEMESDCDWQLVIKPMVGPSGGGARGF